LPIAPAAALLFVSVRNQASRLAELPPSVGPRLGPLAEWSLLRSGAVPEDGADDVSLGDLPLARGGNTAVSNAARSARSELGQASQ
jgi:hypothetical protein